ncbi:MAG: glutaredoxin domain-containing protein [Candidatus Aenigmatarchaeota archaeon]
MAKPKVIIYSTEWCPWCVKLKEWLAQNKVPFEEKNIEADKEAAAEMIEKSGQESVPVADIGGEIIVGFDVPALKKTLKLK